MEKWVCWATMGLSGLMLALFVMDLVTRTPFGGLSKVVDILGAASAGLVCYLAWDASQDSR
jgi:hypothetical protein